MPDRVKEALVVKDVEENSAGVEKTAADEQVEAMRRQEARERL